MQLFEEATIGGVKLKNRIVRSATFEGAADANGMPLESLGRIYKMLAANGVGAIITGFTYVRHDGRAMHPGQAGCDDNGKVIAYLPLIEMVHGYGCRIFYANSTYRAANVAVGNWREFDGSVIKKVGLF